MGNNFSSKEVVLSILIVNFNGKDFLGPCFDSIRQHVTIPYEIIVVDNASHDGSVEYIKAYYPDINLIVSDNNLGFAAGNNLAACSSKSNYLLLLNNDTLLLDDLKSAVALLSSNHTIGALGCRMIGRNSEYRYSTGHFPSPLRLLSFSTIFNRSGLFKKGIFPAGNKKFYNVDWVEGSFILTRKDLWQALNGMDEGYFMYGEDIDFCKRVKDFGYKVIYFPSLSFLHYGGYSSNRLGMLIKGFRRYHKKYSNGFIQLMAQLILTSGLIIRVCSYALISLVCERSVGTKSRNCLKALKDSPW
jgi:GT2 family glycosyltransferase